MTPAVNQVKKAKVAHTLHRYDHDPSARAFGEEAVEKLGISPDRMFKTLVVAVDGSALAVGIVPVSGQLDLKLFARAVNAKKATMADPADVQRSTGYVLGGVSPLGQKKRLTTVIDPSAWNFDTILVSAGRRGLSLELTPDDLKNLTRARKEPIAC